MNSQSQGLFTLSLINLILDNQYINLYVADSLIQKCIQSFCIAILHLCYINRMGAGFTKKFTKF